MREVSISSLNRDASSPSLCCVLSTFPSFDEARNTIRALVQEHLIACGSLLPAVQSIYVWDQQLQDAEEVLTVLKTTEDRVEALQSRLIALHPYDVPECLVLPVGQAFEPYVQWVRECVKEVGEKEE